MPIELNKQFEQWLLTSPDALSKMIDILKQWYANQGKPLPIGDHAGSGPDEFVIGGKPVLETVAITHEDLDAVSLGYATAEVKERAIIWLKGLLAGVLISV